MFAARTVTPLAIDTFRNTSGEHGFGTRLAALRRNVRNAVVTEHATVRDGPCEAGMILTIVAGIHRPFDGRSAVFRVPRKRKFHESVAAGPVKERLRVIAGSHDEVDLFLETVRLLPVETDLIPPLVKPSGPLDHCEIAVGGFVVEGDGIFRITDCIADCGPAE